MINRCLAFKGREITLRTHANVAGRWLHIDYGQSLIQKILFHNRLVVLFLMDLWCLHRVNKVWSEYVRRLC